jgi:hypothetical protein
VNPQSGKKLQSFELDGYGRSMEFFKFRDKQLLAVGISSSSDPGVKPNGETKRYDIDELSLFLYFPIVLYHKVNCESFFPSY